MRKYFVRVPKWSRFVYSKAIWSYEKIDKVIWTIDDGPHPESTHAWLEFLFEQNQEVIFFLTGSNCEKYPKLLDDIRLAGHNIGSHGFDHLDGWKTPTDKYISNVRRGMDIVKSDLFRPPYGRMTRSQYVSLSKISTIMMWSVMPGDFDTTLSGKTLLKRSDTIHPGDVVVLHDSPQSFKNGSLLIKSVLSRLKK